MKYILALQFFLVYSAYSQHNDFNDIGFSNLDSIAINYTFKGHIDPIKVATDLTKRLEKDIDKYRVIFRWISENIDYDIKLYLKQASHDYDARLLPGKHKRWNKKLTKLYTKHTIKKRMTICEGYSWLLETMCSTAGLSCVSVPGYAKNEDSMIGVKTKPNHAWNAIKINNKWYLSDPTWASGYVKLERTKYYRDFDETYFLVSPDEFIANHYPTDAQWILLRNKPTLVEFINSPIKTTAFIENKIPNYSPINGKINLKKDSVFKFEFSINKELKSFNIERSTFRNKKFVSETLTDYPKRNKENYYVSSLSFSEKGDYAIRIYINRELTFIYKVLVK
jgi:transglutaminase/protease-like cytokinesis protein 3